jgi:hypothetical protein
MAGLVGPATSETYGYVGTSETVARIANSRGTVTDSIVSATGDRIGVKVGSTVNWLLPDLHGNTGASLSADEAAVTNSGLLLTAAQGAAIVRYQRTMDYVESLSQRHRPAHISHQDRQVVGRTCRWCVHRGLRRGGEQPAALGREGARAGARVLPFMGIGLDFAGGALSQAELDKGRGFDDGTALRRNFIRGGLNAGGALAGQSLMAAGMGLTNWEAPGASNGLAAIVGLVLGGATGQRVGDDAADQINQ